MEHQVAVIGGGPVGLGLAIELGQRGVSCALVEAEAELHVQGGGRGVDHAEPLDLAGRRIRINAVSPGPIETPILPDFIEMLGERAQESLRNLERMGTPADVAPTVAFLLSEEPAWIRGANLTPDGGMGAHLALKPYGLA